MWGGGIDGAGMGAGMGGHMGAVRLDMLILSYLILSYLILSYLMGALRLDIMLRAEWNRCMASAAARLLLVVCLSVRVLACE